MKKLLPKLTVLFILAAFSACQSNRSQSGFLHFVDPFIGTDFHGHTFPGAALPFGMMQLSPDTRTKGWDACSGYHYSDSSIIGFSHTHLSGTGIGDYGDILFMPFTGTPAMNPGSAASPASGYRSRFNHNSESASPGYYQVFLEDYKINSEFTTTLRSGMHRYTFPDCDSTGIIIDLRHTIHGHENTLHELQIVNDHTIRGLKVTRGWATQHYVYFTASFNKNFYAEVYEGDKLLSENSQYTGKNIHAGLFFPDGSNDELLVKIAISPVDYKGAEANLAQEIPAWDFNEIKKQAEAAWEDKLSKIKVSGENTADKRTFYTALYHSYLAPQLYSDVDGHYRSMKQEILHSESPNYTVFSLWDTYRALHPLFTIMEAEQNQDFIRALLRKYDEGGILPMWELASNYTGTMIGSHAVSVIVDAYMKGQRDFDAEKALEAIVHAVRYDTSNNIAFPSNWVKQQLMPEAKRLEEEYGFIPADLEASSVSKALEFAYNYWAIATMAEEMGRDSIAEEFYEKAKRYSIYFDSTSGFMRARLRDGSWLTPFHPRYSAHTNAPYVEGNAWQWTWFVPHDVEDLIDLMGGKELFASKLDSLFSTTSEVLGENKSADITGLIGQYAHGNEPSHHIAYLYNFADKPWKTQEVVQNIMDDFYTDQPDGLCGNEDCGQMSAWYVMNAMGFYPVCPGDGRYSISVPLFDRITIQPDEGKSFIITAENLDSENPYVQEVYLNKKKLTSLFITHKDIENGGSLHFVMGPVKKIFWN